ncbi:hypothetical protein L5515_009716 [Caenorhabditis briggsae]|uniref:UNC93-like protein MFSD11 n=1 Tax=Caenorhabditis briggsae TaxID=6238 RepID=A0AAE9FAI9_CAEBR|nr:hypothetical protein L5515_009716 [Caenorhabditis briggsae]
MFPMGFLFFNIYFYYFTAVLLGIGIALLFMGMGAYLSQHSTRETIESNVSISWAIACCCLMVSACIFTGYTTFSPHPKQDDLSQKRYSEREIRILFGIYTGISSIAIVLFGVMPSKNVENSLAESEKKMGFMDSLKLTCSTIKSPKLFPLLPLTILGGFNVSFWLSIFPTAMNFTKANSNLIYIQAVFGLGAGLGEVFTGSFVSAMSKRVKGFGLKPTMLIGTISVIIYCSLVFISTPFEAPMRPTSEKSIWIGQSYPLIFLIAIFCGISDCCINGVRSVICALVLPQRRAQSFAVTRMYHAAACMTCFFFSPIVPLYTYTCLLPILSIFSTFLFFRVVDKTHSMERKITQQVMEEEKIQTFKNQNILTVA